MLSFVVAGSVAVSIYAMYWRARAQVAEARIETAEVNARRAQAVAEDAHKQLRAAVARAAEEREAADAYAARVKHVAEAAAQVEARLLTDDVDEVAEALNKALEL